MPRKVGALAVSFESSNIDGREATKRLDGQFGHSHL